MLRRQIFNSIKNVQRSFSTTRANIFDLTVDNEGIAVMDWKRKPVNSINLEFLLAIKDSLNDLEKNEKYKGLIITSAIPKIFSAGIDLNELHNPDPERLRALWRALQSMLYKLYGSEVITAVAINGHAAAGACVLSLMCDYRVMVNDKSRIGMNDTAVGIVPAWWIREIMIRTMGYRNAEIAITASRMYTADEALKVQMIDEQANDKEDAIEKCKKFIRLYDNVPQNIQSAAKRQLRESIINYTKNNEEMDVQSALGNILNPHVQEKIGNFVQQLQQKSKR